MYAVYVIIGIVLCLWGGNYFLHSLQTSSAIHELAGMVGVALGFVMFALAGLSSSMNEVIDRLRAVDRQTEATAAAAEAAAAVTTAAGVVEWHQPAMALLVAIANAGGGVSPKQRDAILAYLAEAANGGRKFSAAERDQLIAHLGRVPTGEANIVAAVSSVREGASDPHLRRAADAIIKGTKKPTSSQQRLYAAAFS